MAGRYRPAGRFAEGDNTGYFMKFEKLKKIINRKSVDNNFIESESAKRAKMEHRLRFM
jgi:hypothetical protein